MESGETAAAAMSSSTRMWYRFIPGNHNAERSRESTPWIWNNQGRTVDRRGQVATVAVRRVDRWSEVEFSSSLV